MQKLESFVVRLRLQFGVPKRERRHKTHISVGEEKKPSCLLLHYSRWRERVGA